MPVEIPCSPSTRRKTLSVTRAPALMDGLESRTMFAASSSVVHIGPTQAIKTLDAAPWPKQGSKTAVTFLVDYSNTPYKTTHHAVWGNVTIAPSDTSHRPTIQLEQTNYPTFFGNDKLTIKNINTVGGYKGILAGSSKTATLDVENVKMMDGGAVWRGQGCVSALFKNNESYGVPYDYNYGNFNFLAQKVTIDNSGTSVPVQQGVKETAIRVMDVGDLTLINVKIKPHFSNGRIFKQDIQLRPSANHIRLINCNFYIADVGDMTWRKPAKPIQSVEFINCTMVQMPHITAGVGTVKLTNCTVGGKKVSKSL